MLRRFAVAAIAATLGLGLGGAHAQSDTDKIKGNCSPPVGLSQGA